MREDLKMLFPNWLKWTSFIWTLLFIVFCLMIPLSTLFTMAFAGWQEGSAFLGDPLLRFVVQSTLIQTLLSTSISAAIGLVFGVWMGSIAARNHPTLARLLGGLFLSIPFGIPSIVSAMTWVVLLGRSGILAKWGWELDWIYSLKAVVLAHVFLNVPLVTLFVAQARQTLSNESLEMAKTLGAGFFAIYRWLIWPKIKSAFLISSAQVFSLCLMSFSLVLLLGGGPPQVNLETELFQRLKIGSPDWSGAAYCALLELSLALIPWLIIQWFDGDTVVIPLRHRRNEKQSPFFQNKDTSSKFKIYFENYFVLLGIPLIFLIPYSVLMNRQNFSFLLNPHWMTHLILPIQSSLFLAMASSSATILTSLFVMVSLFHFRKDRFFNPTLKLITHIPNGVSILVLGLGTWFAYGQWFDFSEHSWIILVLLQMTLFFPFSFRLICQTAREMNLDQLEAALCLGASPWRAFLQVEWNRWKAPLLSVFSGVSAASLGEVAAASLFCNENWVPLPLLATRWMMQYRFEEAEAIACLLLLLSFGMIGVSSLSHLGRSS